MIVPIKTPTDSGSMGALKQSSLRATFAKGGGQGRSVSPVAQVGRGYRAIRERQERSARALAGGAPQPRGLRLCLMPDYPPAPMADGDRQPARPVSRDHLSIVGIALVVAAVLALVARNIPH